MGQTLTNGIYLPAEGEVRCYDGLASNWTTLDAVVGGYRAHVANENIHITSAERNKWDNGVTQAYVLRYASVSLTALGTVAFSALDNTDNVKIGDKVLDSEGKLFALTAVDSENSTATLSALLIDLSKDSDLSNYYTKGETDTLLSDKADDSGVVHLSGDETAGGNKTFSNNITAPGVKYVSSAETSGQGSSILSLYSTLTFLNGDPSIVARLNFRVLGADGSKSLYPHETDQYVLGLTSRRYANTWTNAINTLNPGTLSLPNLSAGVDISGYITAGDTHNEYTPTVDGWISVILKKTTTSGALAIFIYQGDVSNSYFGNTSLPNETEHCGMVSIPVKAGIVVNIDTRGVNTYVYSAKFYPCIGNV